MNGMTLENIAEAVNGKLCLSQKQKKELLGKEASSVVIDSRLATKDCIFVATKGERTDGHKYIGDVIDKGAFAYGFHPPLLCLRPGGQRGRKMLLLRGFVF